MQIGFRLFTCCFFRKLHHRRDLDAETLEKVRESMKNPKSGTGIGLSNIVQRLRLFYEDDYSFTIDSEEGKGTVIRIQVPIHMKTEEGR